MCYVNKEKQIREMFLDFLSLEIITGKCIGQTKLKFYEEKDINILDGRRQCCGGAHNMQSLKVHRCRFESLPICSCSCKNNTLKISHS